MFSIDHIGVAVKSVVAAKAIYEKLGVAVSPEEVVEAEQVRVVMVPLGDSRLELLEPTSEKAFTMSRCACPTSKLSLSG